MGPHKLHLAGHIEDNSLEVRWTMLQGFHNFKLRIDKCDAKMDCYTIHKEDLTINKMVLHEEIFSQCSLYNVHIEAESLQYQDLRDEISVSNEKIECYLTENLVFTVGFSLLGLLLLGMVAMICYYTRKHPLHKRVRSRLYSRLYSQDMYHQPVKKVELEQFMEIKMKESDPFRQEFDRLDKLASDTIQRATMIAEMPAMKKRNRLGNVINLTSV